MTVSPEIAASPSWLIRGAWIGCAAAIAACAVVLAVSRTAVTLEALACAVGLLAIPAAINFVYSRLRPDPVLAAVGGALAIIGSAAFAATVLGLAALRLQMPLVNSALAHADEAIGLTSPEVLVWLTKHKTSGEALSVIYQSMGPLMFFVIPLLAVMRQTRRLWEMSFIFAATATVTALTSVFLPAIGAVVYYKISPEILVQLPAGAGRFYVPAFEAFRSGALQTISLGHLEGVVTFPSFHAITALLIAHAWRGLPGATLIKVWAALVIFSAIPIGGHYVIDLVVGGALWGVFAAIATRWRGTAAEADPLPSWRGAAAPSPLAAAAGPVRIGGVDGKSDFPL